MKRSLLTLSRSSYDVAVIGGGIYGASVAREAASRGLKVALVEQGDFGNATSANSHKIIHGGLRYLQHGDFRRMRESIRERNALMRIAPHLVFPMPFLIPIYKHQGKGKGTFLGALTLNDVIGFDRNKKLSPDKHLPNGSLISKDDCIVRCPYLKHPDLAGGAIYYDGQIYNPNRFILALLHSACLEGADVANYVRVTGCLRRRNAITALSVIDETTSQIFEIQASIVVNCAGPWVASVLNSCGAQERHSDSTLTKAMVLVTRSIVEGVGVGFPSMNTFRDKDALIDKGYRYFFATPWRDCSLIGTFQQSFEGNPNDWKVNKTEVEWFLQQIQESFPAAGLTKNDVRFVYAGLLPQEDGKVPGSQTSGGPMVKQFQIRDHAQGDGINNLFSVRGVKYTTARGVAEQTVNMVCQRLGKPYQKSQTSEQPVDGGDIDNFPKFLAQAVHDESIPVSEGVRHQLVKNYGTRYQKILNYGRQNSSWWESLGTGANVIGAEVIHGIREEMAHHVDDVVFRRTELGTAGFPGHPPISQVANIMRQELHWNTQRTSEELQRVSSVFSNALPDFEAAMEPACAFS